MVQGVQLHAADGDVHCDVAGGSKRGLDKAVADCEKAFCQSRPQRRKRGPLFVTVMA